jgi:Cdc6-like AAA superfamily ATPase
MTELDSDLQWLLGYVPFGGAPKLHQARVEQLTKLLNCLIADDRLPFTIGLFGGWGSGKTTFLNSLATCILNTRQFSAKVIYFNAWKYAGLMEIFPSLIYKILKYGNHADIDVTTAFKEIMYPWDESTRINSASG